MRDWLFSDMSWLFFATWSAIVAAASYAAFRRDLEHSKALSVSGKESAPRVAPVDSGAR